MALLAFCLLPSTFCLGQGTAFTYQGRLNAGPNPANGLYDLQFGIFDAVTNGNQQGSYVTTNASAVSNGLFTVTLDFGPGIFTGPARWLDISVRTNGAGSFVTLAPRQPLASTPYSIQSANAANAQSVLAGNITGTLSPGQLPSGIVTNGASGVSVSGAFIGDGSGLTNVPGTLSWQIIAGTNFTAAPNQAYLLTNGSMTAVTLPTNANVGDIVTVSGDGSTGWQVIVDPGLAPVWTTNNNSPVANWNSVASSADGTKLVAVVNGGQIYTSSDSGVTWTANTNAPATSWTSVASSADGTRVVAGANGGQIYTSGDSGSHWSPATNLPTGLTSIASSADGTKLVAMGGVASGTFEYTSTNSGTTWTARTGGQLPGSIWTSVASSADGTKLVANLEFIRIQNGASIDISTNSGANWLSVYVNNTTPFPGFSVASSSDGTKLVSVIDEHVVTSTNSGALNTWSINTNFSSARSVASSADGINLVVGTDGGGIYSSTDSGITWLSDNTPATNWHSLASSVDGTHLVAVVYGGKIWTAVAEVGAQFAGAAGTSAQFQYLGNGAWQPAGVPASQVTGTLPAADLPANVVTNGENGVTLSGALSGTISGNGNGLTNLNASQLTSGTLPSAALAGTYGNAVTFSNSANSFTGNGGGLTNLNASQLASGTVPDARLSGNVALRASANTFNGTQVVASGNVGISNSSPIHPLSFADQVGDKVSLYASSPTNTCGFAIQSLQLQIHTDTSNADVVIGSSNGVNFAEAMRIKGYGNVGIGTTNPGLNTLQINQTNEYANGYGLVVCNPKYGECVQLNEGAAGNGIGLVVDDAIQGDNSTDLLLVRNNVNSSPAYIMTVTAGGNVGIGTGNPQHLLQVGNAFPPAYCDGGNWVNASDRNAKEDFTVINPRDILEKVTGIPITEWRYKSAGTGERHIGPMAQDFHEAFGLNGGDDTHISTVDEGGVALAAIQGLNEKVEGRSEKVEGRMQKLETENQKLEDENAELKVRLEKLEQLIGARKGNGE
jgi:hypothetical protein